MKSIAKGSEECSACGNIFISKQGHTCVTPTIQVDHEPGEKVLLTYKNIDAPAFVVEEIRKGDTDYRLRIPLRIADEIALLGGSLSGRKAFKLGDMEWISFNCSPMFVQPLKPISSTTEPIDNCPDLINGHYPNCLWVEWYRAQ